MALARIAGIRANGLRTFQRKGHVYSSGAGTTAPRGVMNPGQPLARVQSNPLWLCSNGFCARGGVGHSV
eukprot:14745834-Heterocapsa_arctica.AAC.1